MIASIDENEVDETAKMVARAKDLQEQFKGFLSQIQRLVATRNDEALDGYIELTMSIFSTVIIQYDELLEEYLKSDGAFDKLLEAIEAHADIYKTFQKKMEEGNASSN